MRSSARSAARLLAVALAGLMLLAGCAREAPEIREVRKTAEEYFKALEKRDVKAIADCATCLTSTNSFAGARVLQILPTHRVRMAVLHTLMREAFAWHKTADSLSALAPGDTADSLLTRARPLSPA